METRGETFVGRSDLVTIVNFWFYTSSLYDNNMLDISTISTESFNESITEYYYGDLYKNTLLLVEKVNEYRWKSAIRAIYSNGNIFYAKFDSTGAQQIPDNYFDLHPEVQSISTINDKNHIDQLISLLLKYPSVQSKFRHNIFINNAHDIAEYLSIDINGNYHNIGDDGLYGFFQETFIFSETLKSTNK